MKKRKKRSVKLAETVTFYMKYAELLRELHSLKGATLVTFHSLGDVEAVASGIALSKLLHNCTVKSPDRTNSASRHLLEKLNMEKIPLLKSGELKNFNNVVLVDVANKEMLAGFGSELAQFKGKVIAIDHHEHGNLLKNAKIFEFAHRTSCCEIIYDLYRVSGRKIEPIVATLLLAGIISDTARFKTANRETFHAVTQLLIASGGKYEEVLTMVKSAVDNAEVKSVLKAVQNAGLIETPAGMIGIARSNAFEAKCCAVLVDMGCVAAICANAKAGKIAMLKDSENPNAAVINVGELMKAAGRNLQGSGGGHEGIGGASGKPTLVEKAVWKIVEKTRKAIGG